MTVFYLISMMAFGRVYKIIHDARYGCQLGIESE